MIDDHTVIYHFNEVYPYQVMDARDGPIMPAHILEDIPHAELGRVPAEQFPVTGPFMIGEWDKGQKLVLKANPRYYEKDKPRLDRVIFKIIPDQVTLVTQLRHGEVDCMEAVPEDQIDNIIRDNPELKVFDFLGRGYNYIGWNGAVEPFGSVPVRRALTMAIDRKKIIENAKYGYAEECVSPFIPLIWAYNPDIEPLPYDPERALKLLEKEGFTDTDGDGFLDRKGERFEFELLTNHGSQVRTDIQVMVQEMLRKIGVKVNPVQLEWTVMLERHKASDFEAIITAWRTGTKADLAPIWSCEARKKGGYNRVDYCNSRVDSLNQLATATLDFDRARPLFHKAQEIIYYEQPYTFLYFAHTIFVLNRKFGGAEPDAISCFHNLHEWYLREEE
jgi:peptide/nickel transport system substrate-binding protein